MNDLVGKRILLISNHGYSKQIAEEIKSLGGEVIVLNDKPNDGFIAKTCGRIKFKPYIKHVVEKYYFKNIEMLSNKGFDYILSIRGEYTPESALSQMKEVFPNAKLILYMWDSIINNRGIEKKWSNYDEVWTFDRKDYLNHKNELKFQPLFYCEKVLPSLSNDNEYKYDMAFIGTGHEDRIEIIKKLEEQCKEKGLNFFYYIYVPHILVYFYNKIFNPHYKNVKKGDVHFKLMPLDEVYKIYSASKCILDVESATQTGLTMRTIENIGIRKKLMTTNTDIINYDFYNSNNILIINRSKPQIDASFISSRYEELDMNIYNKYSLKNWLMAILSEDNR